jgi:hypothetical protein
MEVATARNNESTTIDGIRSRKLEVMTLEVEAGKEVPKARKGVWVLNSSDSLARAYDADLVVLKWSYRSDGEIVRRKENVVINPDSNLRINLLHSCAALPTLVSFGDRNHFNSDIGVRVPEFESFQHLVADLGRGIEPLVSYRNYHYLLRLVSQNGPNAFAEILVLGCDGGYDSGYVGTPILGIERDGSWLVHVVSNDMYQRAHISKQEEAQKHGFWRHDDYIGRTEL